MSFKSYHYAKSAQAQSLLPDLSIMRNQPRYSYGAMKKVDTGESSSQPVNAKNTSSSSKTTPAMTQAKNQKMLNLHNGHDLGGPMDTNARDLLHKRH